jgi:hypothetical protein
MDLKTSQNPWLNAVFDVSQPYLYLIILPALILFALGYRGQAILFALGAAALLTVLALK